MKTYGIEVELKRFEDNLGIVNDVLFIDTNDQHALYLIENNIAKFLVLCENDEAVNTLKDRIKTVLGDSLIKCYYTEYNHETADKIKHKYHVKLGERTVDKDSSNDLNHLFNTLNKLYLVSVKPDKKDEFILSHYIHVTENIKAYPHQYIRTDKWLICIDSTDKDTILKRLINKGNCDEISDEIAELIQLKKPNLSEVNDILRGGLSDQNWYSFLNDYRYELIIKMMYDKLDSISKHSYIKGVSGATYGDSPYDSMSACYGYNGCLESIKSDIHSTLEDINHSLKR